MNRIESKDNQKIKRLKSLDKRKVREQENLFFVDGKKLVDEAFKSKAEIAEIYVSDDFYQKNMSYVDKLDCDNIYLIRDGILDSLSYMSNPESDPIAKHSFGIDSSALLYAPAGSHFHPE